MKWLYHRKNSLTMVYGFKRDDRRYDAVLTLHEDTEKNHTAVYGFLSRVTLELKDFVSLWKTLKEAVKTRYLLIEVLPEHEPVYTRFLPVESRVKTKTFNGLESHLLWVDITKGSSR